MRLHLALLLFCGPLFLPAQAGWQFTQWNMSRDAAVAASQGSVHAVEGRPGQRRWGLDLKAEGRFTDGAFTLESRFFFDKAGQLKAISFDLADLAQCPAFRKSVEQRYGKPDGTSSVFKGKDFSEYWHAQDFVRWNETEGIACFVITAPPGNADANGLTHF
jgi:hypothetical protein